jgi:hypothetical protein
MWTLSLHPGRFILIARSAYSMIVTAAESISLPLFQFAQETETWEMCHNNLLCSEINFEINGTGTSTLQ